MAIQINSLEALERLIGGDTELEIDIRNSVVQNFSKKHLKGVASELKTRGIEEAIKTEIRKATENTLERLRFAQYNERFKKEVYKEVLDLIRKERDLDVPHDSMKLSARLIAEDKLIHSLQRKYIPFNDPNRVRKCHSLAGEILNTKLFSVDKCWVSLEEKKPQNGSEFLALALVTYPTGETEEEIYVGAILNGKAEILEPSVYEYPVNYSPNTYVITHWMELPAKPRK